MRATLIGALITLAIVLIAAYQHSETFRNIVHGAFTAVGRVAEQMRDTVVGVFNAIKSAGNFLGEKLTAVAHTIGAAFQWLLGPINAVLSAINAVIDAARAAKNAVEAIPHPNIFGGGGFGGRQHGGPVSARMPYVVGEAGPELFIPRVGGTIIPNAAGARAGGQQVIQLQGDVYLDGEKVGRLMHAWGIRHRTRGGLTGM